MKQDNPRLSKTDHDIDFEKMFTLNFWYGYCTTRVVAMCLIMNHSVDYPRQILKLTYKTTEDFAINKYFL